MSLTLAVGCLTPQAFPCDSDADCTGAAGGRCEDAGFCSFFDDSCASGRRFSVHAGAHSEVCTTPIAPRPLRNACVAGEPWPTPEDPCAAAVCAVVPACCEAIWGEACVTLADQLCTAHCGAWLAAASPTTTSVMMWTGTSYAPRSSPGGPTDQVAWLDARDGRPRLAQSRGGGLGVLALEGPDAALTFAQTTSFLNGGTTIRGIAAVDADGDDAIELGYVATGTGGPHVGLLEVSSPVAAPIDVFPSTPEANAIAWGDYTGDRIPDVALATVNGYSLLKRLPSASYSLAFFNNSAMQPYRSVGWADVDGDGRLDLIAIGGSVVVHLGDGATISETPTKAVRSPNTGVATGAAGDLDGDHRADLVAAVSVGEAVAGKLVVHHGWDLATSQFAFELEVVMARVHQLALRDVDDDGRLDVIAATESGVVWLRNTSSGGVLKLAAPAPLAAPLDTTSISLSGWTPR